jgi:hypothetical protein
MKSSRERSKSSGFTGLKSNSVEYIKGID